MKKVIAIMLAVVMCLGLAACGKKEAPAPAATTPAPAASTPAPAASTPAPAASTPAASGPVYEETVLQLAHVNAVDNACALSYDMWNDLLKTKSDGKVSLDIYPAGQLYGQQDADDACTLGELDITQADISVLTSKVPRAGVLCLAMFYTSYEKAAKVFYGPVGDKVNEAIADTCNYHIMGWMWNGFRNIASRDPLDELADCKGYKLRSPATDLYLNTFIPMGFSPVQTAWGEAYTAMQSGLVDAVESGIAALYQTGFCTLGGHVTKTNHILSVIGPCMNKDTWDGLSPDVQNLLAETWAEAQAWENEKVAGDEQVYFDKCVEEGIEVLEWKNPQELLDLFTPQWSETAEKGGFSDLFEEALKTIQ